MPKCASPTFPSSSISGPSGAAPANRSAPRWRSLSAEYDGKVKIVKVNVDENPNSPMQLGVRGIPALFMFKGGEVMSNKVGAAPRPRFRSGSTRPSDGRCGNS
jgi:hypothetical protein